MNLVIFNFAEMKCRTTGLCSGDVMCKCDGDVTSTGGQGFKHIVHHWNTVVCKFIYCLLLGIQRKGRSLIKRLKKKAK